MSTSPDLAYASHPADAVPTQKSNGSAPAPRVLNLAEAASLVRCSRAHLSNVVKGKVKGIPQLPAVRIGRRLLFRREALESWLEQVEGSTTARPLR